MSMHLIMNHEIDFQSNKVLQSSGPTAVERPIDDKVERYAI